MRRAALRRIGTVRAVDVCASGRLISRRSDFSAALMVRRDLDNGSRRRRLSEVGDRRDAHHRDQGQQEARTPRGLRRLSPRESSFGSRAARIEVELIASSPFARRGSGTEAGRTREARPAHRSSSGRAISPATAEADRRELARSSLAGQAGVTATMQTTAIRATRRAYSTSEAPRSVLQRAWSQALANSYEVSIWVGLPLSGANGWSPSEAGAWLPVPMKVSSAGERRKP